MIRNRPIKVEPAPSPGEFATEDKYRSALRAWSEMWSIEERAYNAALVRVIRFAMTQLLGQPAWWLSGKAGQELDDALEEVLAALTPEQQRALDELFEGSDER